MRIDKDKRIRLKDIAEKAQISVSAVSMALADSPQIGTKTKHRIRVLSRELGYGKDYATKSNDFSMLSKKEFPRFALVLLGTRLTDEAQGSFLHSLSINALTENVRIEVVAIEDVSDSSKVANTILAYAKNVNGFLLSGLVDIPLLDQIGKTNVCWVVIGHIMAFPGFFPMSRGGVVTPAEQEMGSLAVFHLIAHGHKRIAFICEVLPEGLSHYRWFCGYRLALMDNGLTPDQSFVYIAGKKWAGGEKAAEEICSMTEPPSAFVIPDVRIASSFIQAMRKNGHEVKPDTIVMGGNPDVVNHYGLADYPLITADSDNVSLTAIRRLRELCENPSRHFAEEVVPFKTYNMSNLSQNQVNQYKDIIKQKGA